MKAFSNLFAELDATTSTKEKVSAIKKYLTLSNSTDSLWAILLLTGRLGKRAITSKALRHLFLQATSYSEWLFEACAAETGDTAETISLLLGSLDLCKKLSDGQEEVSLTQWMETEIPELAKLDCEEEKSRRIFSWWLRLTQQEVFVLNKLMTGGFRVGASEKLVIRAIAETFSLPSDIISHRLTGIKGADSESFARLTAKDDLARLPNQPYPFCLAHPWAERKEEGFAPEEWAIEWKYDGIRAQVIKRNGQVWIWSRGEEDITTAFPDLTRKLTQLPEGSVLDGEILVINGSGIQSFQSLQKRMGRKKVPANVASEFPAGIVFYDLLEDGGSDIRQKPLTFRRRQLEAILKSYLDNSIRLSESISANSMDELEVLRQLARSKNAEGLMLKAWTSNYAVGRKTGNWWKHKVNPLSLDAVLLYAQAGTGRRANLYTDYTFALWDKENKLVPFAKAYSGLNQTEIDELDSWIRRHTKEKFGPVRSLEPFFVFEIGFEGILHSSRHKSGIAVRFPRILRWRKDKSVDDADKLDSAFELLRANP